ncbi:TetR/AcrR family transcriptional regulator [Reinekea blandensis]|uniref:Prophage Sa05, transcriptional regulator, putative n=1 Tax=Reinekea blandensis MED297 TaxID=314283 RepID=A4BD23_9GAMM|nr:TetR/AcrR family transcriptional regulator [Reinekea blandensis]EAR10105.1 prophage Sa05, transcriptional regulator, putative [Reinekea sp. MED297] [Reinekea blandensis MED297]
MKSLNRTSRRSVELIESAMLNLLQESSFNKIRVAQICQRAGVSRPTFYAHFADKTDVLARHIAMQLEPVALALQQVPVGRSELAAREVIRVFFATWQRWHDDFEMYQHNHLIDLVKAYYLQIQFEFYEHKPELNTQFTRSQAETMFAYFTGGLFSVLEWWIEQGQDLSVEQITDRVLSLLPVGES